jgi:hypothetical protein
MEEEEQCRGRALGAPPPTAPVAHRGRARGRLPLTATARLSSRRREVLEQEQKAHGLGEEQERRAWEVLESVTMLEKRSGRSTKLHLRIRGLLEQRSFKRLASGGTHGRFVYFPQPCRRAPRDSLTVLFCYCETGMNATREKRICPAPPHPGLRPFDSTRHCSSISLFFFAVHFHVSLSGRWPDGGDGMVEVFHLWARARNSFE